MDLQKFNRNILLENKWLRLFEDNYELPNGANCTYYHAEQNDAAMAIALEGSGAEISTYIVNQYRHPINQTIWQFPLGGFNAQSEDPTEAARNELLQESGLKVGSMRFMGSFFANPGFTNQKLHVCVTSDIIEKTEPELEKTEYGLISKKVLVGDIPNLIETGEMGDAWGITGLYYLNRFLATCE